MKPKHLLLTILISFAFLTQCDRKVNHPDEQDMAAFIDALLSKMTLDEKIGQLNLLPGYEDIVTGQAVATEIGRKVKEGKVGAMLNVKSVGKIRELQQVAVEESRLKIPMIFGMDVIHGYKTVFRSHWH